MPLRMNQFLRYTPDVENSRAEETTLWTSSALRRNPEIAENVKGTGWTAQAPWNQERPVSSYRLPREWRRYHPWSSQLYFVSSWLDKKRECFWSSEIKEAMEPLFVLLQRLYFRVPIELDMQVWSRVSFINTTKTHVFRCDLGFAYINELNSMGSIVPGISNFFE